MASMLVFPSAVGIGLENSAHYAISDDGQKIVFTTSEALSPRDGNGEPDVYLWTPQGVSLISTGSGPPLVGGNGGAEIQRPRAVIDGSGQDIYFESAAALTPADGDEQADVYDARVGGGFSFAEPICSGEACQPPPSNPRPSEPPGSETPGSGNTPAPKPCPKGKVRRHGKCVKKPKNTPARNTTPRKPVITGEVESENRSRQPIEHFHREQGDSPHDPSTD